jgi:hypothetical protein
MMDTRGRSRRTSTSRASVGFGLPQPVHHPSCRGHDDPRGPGLQLGDALAADVAGHANAVLAVLLDLGPFGRVERVQLHAFARLLDFDRHGRQFGAGSPDHDVHRGGLPHEPLGPLDLDGRPGHAAGHEERSAEREQEEGDEGEQVTHGVMLRRATCHARATRGTAAWPNTSRVPVA